MHFLGLNMCLLYRMMNIVICCKKEWQTLDLNFHVHPVTHILSDISFHGQLI